jgi:hypothetical protein
MNQGIAADRVSEPHAIFCPSGDQAGSPSKAALLVSFVCPEPSAFMT